MFWTIPVNPYLVDAHWPAAHASFHAHTKEIDDYGNIVNAIVEGPSTSSIASFNIEWFDPIKRVTIDATNNAGFGGSDWGGHFAEMNATAEWSMRQPGFEFHSDPAATSELVFAFLGHERNGIYFHP